MYRSTHPDSQVPIGSEKKHSGWDLAEPLRDRKLLARHSLEAGVGGECLIELFHLRYASFRLILMELLEEQ